MTTPDPRARGALIWAHDVSYTDHNLHPPQGMEERLRLRAMANHLLQACNLTDTRQRALYLTLRKTWAILECRARQLEREYAEHLRVQAPPLFPTLQLS